MKHSENIRNQIIYLTLAGMPAKTIRSVTGVSISAICTIQKKAGINPRPRARQTLAQDVIDEIEGRVRTGQNWLTITRELQTPKKETQQIIRACLKRVPHHSKKKRLLKRFDRFQTRAQQELGADPEWLKTVLRDALRRSA